MQEGCKMGPSFITKLRSSFGDRQEPLWQPVQFNVVPQSSSLKGRRISQAFFLSDLKLIYLPIAKNASSSLKRVFAELGGLEIKRGEGIHRKLHNDSSGILFKDRTDEELRDALADPNWMRLLVWRDPLDRLVSAYTEKFVKNRMNQGLFRTSGPVLQSVLDLEVNEVTLEHFERGITFRQFAEHVLTEGREFQNNHWRPQSDYLGHICFTHMYDFQALDRLADDLCAHVGRALDIPQLNVTRSSKRDARLLEDAWDMKPCDLPDVKQLNPESFLEPSLRRRLEEFYATDMSIYRLVQKSQ